jgi:hypothetical protein
MKIKKKNELLSSVYGRIEGLTLAIPLNITDFPYRAYFTELVEVFFEKEIILFYPKAETDKQAEYYSKVLNSLPKSKLLFVETGEKQLSPWTRDAFLGLSAAENETVLLNTYAQPQNRNLAAELAKVKKHIQIQRVNLNLTGGNILKADDYALFGNRKENNDPVLLKTNHHPLSLSSTLLLLYFTC